MAEVKEIELKSDEVQELLGNAPSWVAQWGISFIIFSVVAFLWVGLLIKYPDIIQAPVTLTTEMPPVAVVARSESYIIDIFVKENETVEKDQVLGILSNPAIYEHVLEVENAIANIDPYNSNTFQNLHLDKNLALGSIQNSYLSFVNALKAYQNNTDSDLNSSMINQFQQSIRLLQKSIKNEEEKKEQVALELAIRNKKYKQLRDAYRGDRQALKELEEARLAVSLAEKEIKDIESDIDEKKAQITSWKNSIAQARGGSIKTASENLAGIEKSLKQLRNAILSWKMKYLLMAPIPGTVSFFNTAVSENQFVRQGEEILTIIPKSQDKMVARIQLPLYAVGKVEEGQKVLIRFPSYPFQEYGKVEGIISYKARVPKDETLALEVALPNALKTTKGKNIKFEQQMVGTAEIITDEKTFFSWVFDKLFT